MRKIWANTKEVRKIGLVVGLWVLSSLTTAYASNADFSLKAKYKRNKKIWGTYKLSDEKINIKRGKLKWHKNPTDRIGDVIISGGNIIFVRETKVQNQTKVVVDKVPYKKKGKNKFVNKFPLTGDIMNKLYKNDLAAIIPHRDLLDGDIRYDKLTCTKTRRGALTCEIQGELVPQT